MKISVSIVIPMYNAEKHIVSVLESLLSQDFEGNKEVIVVNDGSTDTSRDLIRGFEREGKIRVIDQPNQGAAAATNNGFRAARYDIICSVDSDVVLHSDWLRKIIMEFDDPQVGAVQGYCKTPKNISFWAKMMGYDVEKRYDDIPGKYVTQVGTADTAYRRVAVDKAGLFDPAFIYGYDNDMSYRLQKAGYKLVFRKDALCDHYWKADLKSYVNQQYCSAYGRIQLIQRHKDKITGDSVSGPRMILQVPLMLLLAFLLLAGTATYFIGLTSLLLWSGLAVLCILLVDRLTFTLSVLKKQKDLLAAFLPFVHLLRNLVWSWAFLMWTAKQLRNKS
jgi:cellulose synthase/poly-beta-1,6-N-acetylglucosamine synthase-like glycosyltransferase